MESRKSEVVAPAEPNLVVRCACFRSKSSGESRACRSMPVMLSIPVMSSLSIPVMLSEASPEASPCVVSILSLSKDADGGP